MSKPLYQVIERPIISEKSVRASQAGRYTFRCKTDANKIEIRQAVEKAFGVQVEKVNTLIVKGKTRQMGRRAAGRTADYKKAIVTLSADSKVSRLKEIFEGA
jgi:large subunit ribosomal protein L23